MAATYITVNKTNNICVITFLEPTHTHMGRGHTPQTVSKSDEPTRKHSMGPKRTLCMLCCWIHLLSAACWGELHTWYIFYVTNGSCLPVHLFLYTEIRKSRHLITYGLDALVSDFSRRICVLRACQSCLTDYHRHTAFFRLISCLQYTYYAGFMCICFNDQQNTRR